MVGQPLLAHPAECADVHATCQPHLGNDDNRHRHDRYADNEQHLFWFSIWRQHGPSNRLPNWLALRCSRSNSAASLFFGRPAGVSSVKDELGKRPINSQPPIPNLGNSRCSPAVGPFGVLGSCHPPFFSSLQGARMGRSLRLCIREQRRSAPAGTLWACSSIPSKPPQPRPGARRYVPRPSPPRHSDDQSACDHSRRGRGNPVARLAGPRCRERPANRHENAQIDGPSRCGFRRVVLGSARINELRLHPSHPSLLIWRPSGGREIVAPISGAVSIPAC